MLEELRISNLGVIDDAVLKLSAGLTVVTGEPGAGQQIVVTGLGLLFGGRAESGLVRSGAARAAVDGRIRVIGAAGVMQRVEELGADVEDGSLLLSRVVGADGRSRAQIGGGDGLNAERIANIVAIGAAGTDHFAIHHVVTRAVIIQSGIDRRSAVGRAAVDR